jgi:hypothetical protein
MVAEIGPDAIAWIRDRNVLWDTDASEMEEL